MRRGLPWHLATIILVGRGHLPTSDETLREAFGLFFAADDMSGEDPLEYAERTAAQAVVDRRLRGVVAHMGGNFRTAKLTDAVTGEEIPLEQGLISVLIHMILAGHKDATMDTEAGTYVAAAQGLLAGVAETDREGVGACVAAVYEMMFAFPVLAQLAQQVLPAELQRAVLVAQHVLATMPPMFRRRLPSGMLDVFFAIAGLMLIKLTNGGFEALLAEHQAAIGHLSSAFGLGLDGAMPGAGSAEHLPCTTGVMRGVSGSGGGESWPGGP